MKTTVTFGEIMGRLCPPGFDRFAQAMPGRLDVTFAGAEANVAVTLAYLGSRARFVSALPRHAIADACLESLTRFGVDVSGVQRTDEGRLGLYFVERGANQRPSRVIYDREHASIAQAEASSFDWDTVLAGADWFHVTGITPALSAAAAASAREGVRQARRRGLTVSCDLNFREKLWRWRPGTTPRALAGEVMSDLLSEVEVVIANEADAADVLGIRAANSQVEHGELDVSRYPEVAAALAARFPSVRRVAITLRESVSASHNNWGAMLYDGSSAQAYFAPLNGAGQYQPYEIRQIVDRVG